MRRLSLIKVVGASIPLLVGLASSCRAATVERGWDLFATTAGTSALGVPMEGVPIGSFNFSYYPGDTTGDFGRGIGVQNVGTTDTIVKRLEEGILGVDSSATHVPGSILSLLTNPATGGLDPFSSTTSARIGLEMVALQLKTVTATTFGGLLPLDVYYETLQSDRGVFDPVPDHVGNPGDPGKNNTLSPTTSFSLGIMDIFNPDSPTGGMFNSSLFIQFDIRQGSLMGPIAYSDAWVLRGGGEWRRDGSGLLLIDRVNFMLPDVANGIAGDFHPFGVISESAVFDPTPPTLTLGNHNVTSTPGVPDSGTTLTLLLIALGLLDQLRRNLAPRET